MTKKLRNDERLVLRFLRLLCGGILSTAECEGKSPGLLRNVGFILRDITQCVEKFYMFYASEKSFPATKYAGRWKAKDFSSLRSRYLQIPLSKGLEADKNNSYTTACRTGTFSPLILKYDLFHSMMN